MILSGSGLICLRSYGANFLVFFGTCAESYLAPPLFGDFPLMGTLFLDLSIIELDFFLEGIGDLYSASAYLLSLFLLNEEGTLGGELFSMISSPNACLWYPICVWRNSGL